ncbi:MAG: Maf family nucleotide pyrophosphatase [Bacteroidota bacterium]
MNLKHPLILASNSPRRQQLLREMGIPFTVQVKDTPEDFPEDMPVAEVPGYLARKKATAFANDLSNAIILTADTVVIIDGKILNKPADAAEARYMLRTLSGRMHEVITGVCVLRGEQVQVFSDSVYVYFAALSDEEIGYYITHHRPFDKAGAYGAQDWLGLVGIERIEGSYFTVMGLPTHKVYAALREFSH